jgi:hypothetical protein
MKKIGDITGRMPHKITGEGRQSQSQSQSYDEKIIHTAKIVNGLFDDLLDIFHSMKYTHGFQDDLDRIKRTWVLTFIENNFLDASIFEIGLRKLRANGDEFLPTPGKFMKLCLPEPKEIKWQSDTRDKTTMNYYALESDERKQERIALGKKNCSYLLNLLRGKNV